MLRFAIIPILMLLGGCAEGLIAPDKLPAGATSGVFIAADPTAIASCIAEAVGNPVQRVADRLVIISNRYPDVSYSISSSGAPKETNVYTTQIAIMGTNKGTEESKKVDECITANAPRG